MTNASKKGFATRSRATTKADGVLSQQHPVVGLKESLEGEFSGQQVGVATMVFRDAPIALQHGRNGSSVFAQRHAAAVANTGFAATASITTMTVIALSLIPFKFYTDCGV